jgi:hypothetical protein
MKPNKLNLNQQPSSNPYWHGLFGLHYYLNGNKIHAAFFLLSYFFFPVWFFWILYNFWEISKQNSALADQEKKSLEEILNAPIQSIKKLKNNPSDHLTESTQITDDPELAELRIQITDNLDQISNTNE